MIVACAITLSLIESLAQFLLKRFALGQGNVNLVGGVATYGVVAMALASFYAKGIDLAEAQVAWSITSSAVALLSGALFFGEPVVRLVAPAGFLALAQIFLLAR